MSNKGYIFGVVKVKRVAVGSKSEHDAVVLETGTGPDLRLRVQGDNPFENNLLKPYVGKRVRISGAEPVPNSNIVTIQNVADITVLGPPGKPSKPKPPTL